MDPWAADSDSHWQLPSTSTTTSTSTSVPIPIPIPEHSTSSPTIGPQPDTDAITDPWAADSPIKEKFPSTLKSSISQEAQQNDPSSSSSSSSTAAETSISLDPWSSDSNQHQNQNQSDSLTPRANSDLPLPSSSSHALQDGGWGDSLEQSYQPPDRLESDPWGTGNLQSSASQVGREEVEAGSGASSGASRGGDGEDGDRIRDWNPSQEESSIRTSSSSWYEPKMTTNSNQLYETVTEESQPWGGGIGSSGSPSFQNPTSETNPSSSTLPSLSKLSISADNRNDLVCSMMGDKSKNSEEDAGTPSPSTISKELDSGSKKETKSSEATATSTTARGGFLSSWRNRVGSTAATQSSNPNDPSMGSIQPSEPNPSPSPPPQAAISTTASKASSKPPPTKEVESKESAGGAGPSSIISGFFKRREAPEISSAVSDDEEEEGISEQLKPQASKQSQPSDPFDIASPDLNEQDQQPQPTTTVGKLFGRWGKRPVSEQKKKGEEGWKDQDFDWLNNVASSSDASNNNDFNNGRVKSLGGGSSTFKDEQDWFESFEGNGSKPEISTSKSNYPSSSVSSANKFSVSSTSRGCINGNRSTQIRGGISNSESNSSIGTQKQNQGLDWDAFESLGSTSKLTSSPSKRISHNPPSSTISSNFTIPPPPSNPTSLNRSQSLKLNSNLASGSNSAKFSNSSRINNKPTPPSNLGFGFVSKHTASQTGSDNNQSNRLFSNESNLSGNSRVTSGTESMGSQDAFGSFDDWETKSPQQQQHQRPSLTIASISSSQNNSNSVLSNRTSSFKESEPKIPSIPPSSKRYGNPAYGLKSNHNHTNSSSSISNSGFEGRYSDNFAGGKEDLDERFEYYGGDDFNEGHPHANVYDEYDEDENFQNEKIGNYSDDTLTNFNKSRISSPPPPLPNKNSELPSVEKKLGKNRSGSPLPPLPRSSLDSNLNSKPDLIGTSSSENQIQTSNSHHPFLPPPPSAPNRKSIIPNSNINCNSNLINASNNRAPLIPPPPSSSLTSTSSTNQVSSVQQPPSLNSPALKHLKTENQSSNPNRNSLSADELSFFDSL